jgi:hypothetical protein
MSGDKLVFDLANEVEDVPNVFVRKDWINILDNQNGNYNSNQSVIDTSQLSNSNKYMSYREGYLAVPMLLTMTTAGTGMIPAQAAAAGNSAGSVAVDFAVGLKNWFGSIIHSLTLDFNGTTVIQQTPFINMWNSFKLMTSLSWQDVASLGPTMGFYPDDPLSWSYQGADSVAGKGVCNNTNMAPPFNLFGVRSGQSFPSDLTVNPPTDGVNYSTFNSYKSGLGNEGFLRRQLYIMYDADAPNGSSTYDATTLTGTSSNALWRSRIITKLNGAPAVFQVAINSFIFLRHIHSFFNQIPLIKGAFMKLTLNLNNTTTQTTVNAGLFTATSVQNAVGGVNPLMISSRSSIAIGGAARIAANDGFCSTVYNNGGVSLGSDATNPYIINLSVGARCLNSAQSTIATVSQSPLSPSIILYVPSYSFNSVFEQAYISSPIKKVIYEDVYQYQVLNVGAGNGQINNLLTNGIANLRSILILPFYSARDNTHLANTGIPVYQSPFDPAGTGPTSPLCMLTNFNVVVSGQNVIYNTERYAFEQFINQTYGVNAINAGITEGLNSSLIDQQGWEMEYCYHYVDVSRMLPVEQQVPKSVQVIGQNTSPQELDLFCFLSYGCELQFDIVSGARI